MIYQLRDAVKDAIENVIDIKNNDVGDVSDLLPPNIKLIKEIIDNANFLNANTITVQAEATNIPPCQLTKIRNMNQEDRIEAEKKLVKIKESFKFNSVAQGKKKLPSAKTSPLSTIIFNLKTRFSSLIEESEELYAAFSIFDVSMWVDGEETDTLIERDNAYIETLGKSFKAPLDIYNFDIKSAKKEWKKVEASVYLNHNFHSFITKLIQKLCEGFVFEYKFLRICYKVSVKKGYKYVINEMDELCDINLVAYCFVY